MKVGIGTYSFGGIASYLGLGPTLLEKFRTIKALGFDSVELLPVDLNHSVEDIKAWLAETGLTVTSVHAEPTEEIVSKMAALGGQAVIWAGTPFNCKEEAIEVAHILEGMAKMAEPYGIKIGYHNHEREFYFDQGKTLFEHLMDNGTGFYSQLDCGWCQVAGYYPPNVIRKYKDRIVAIHVKENAKVLGPGAQTESRHAVKTVESPFAHVAEMTLEQRQEMLDNFNRMIAAGGERFAVQCKMGAPESNMHWQEIRDALNEQSFEAFWVVEREGFYGEHDACIADDCKWLRENIK